MAVEEFLRDQIPRLHLQRSTVDKLPGVRPIASGGLPVVDRLPVKKHLGVGRRGGGRIVFLVRRLRDLQTADVTIHRRFLGR